MEAAKAVDECVERYNSVITDSILQISNLILTKTCESQETINKLLQQLSEKPNPPPTKRMWVPYERNPCFTGRQNFLKALRQKLLDSSSSIYSHRVAIYGLGGIGKTQIAIEYAYRYQAEYNQIFWLHAADRAALLSDFSKIAAKLKCLQTDKDTNLEEIGTAVLDWLNDQTNCLIILDNLDDITVVRGLLPMRSPQRHTLITTRYADPKQIQAEGLAVTEMTEEESMQLLSSMSSSKEGTVEVVLSCDQAREIVAELGNLPLAVDQAGAFIRMGLPGSNLLAMVRSNSATLTEANPEGILYPRSISLTWSISLDHLSPASAQLAQLFSYMNPDEINVEFLKAGSTALENNLKRVVEDASSFFMACKGLQRFSFLKVLEPARKFSMHRLVQAVIRGRMTPEDRLKVEKDVLGLNESAFSSYSLETLDFKGRTKYRSFLPQINACLFYFHENTYEMFAISLLCESIAGFLFEENQRHACAALNAKCLEIRTRILGPDHPDTLRLKRGLAAAYADDDLKAISLLEETMTSQRRVLPPSHPDTLWTQHILGRKYYSRGRIKDAVALLEQTYHERSDSEVLGPTSLHTLRSKYWLAVALMQLTDLKKARQLLEECLDMASRMLGESHKDTFRCVQSLAMVYALMGMNEKAENFRNMANVFS
jgi:hypothetical protein